MPHGYTDQSKLLDTGPPGDACISAHLGSNPRRVTGSEVRGQASRALLPPHAGELTQTVGRWRARGRPSTGQSLLGSGPGLMAASPLSS